MADRNDKKIRKSECDGYKLQRYIEMLCDQYGDERVCTEITHWLRRQALKDAAKKFKFVESEGIDET